MSFERPVFTYTPPPTIPQPEAGQGSASRTAGAPGAGLTASGRAGEERQPRVKDLLKQLDILGKTAAYLEELIAQRTGNPVVNINPKTRPEVIQALRTLYSQNEVPNAISLDMYRHLLDTRTGITQAELLMAGSTQESAIEVNPGQKAALQTLIETFEKEVTEEGEFHQQLAALLPELKGDQLIFTELIDGLNETYLPPDDSDPESETAVLDISPEIYEASKQRLTAWQKYYSTMYGIAAGIDSVYHTIDELTRQFFYEPVEIVLQLIALISTLRILFHKPNLKSIRASMVWMVYPRLISEAGRFMYDMDALVQKAFNPADRVLASLDNLAQKVARVGRDAVAVAGAVAEKADKIQNQAKDLGGSTKQLKANLALASEPDGAAYMTGLGSCTGLTGFITRDITGSKRPKLQLQAIQAFDALPKGLAVIRGQVSWAIHKGRSKNIKLQRQFLKMIDRRLVGGGDRMEILCTLRALDATKTILTSISAEMQRIGPAAKYGREAQRTLTTFDRTKAFGNVLDSIRQGAQIAVTLDDDDKIQVHQNGLPKPTDEVQAALEENGSQEFTEEEAPDA